MWLGRKRRGAVESDARALQGDGGIVAKRDYRAQRRKGAVKVGGIGARGPRKAFLKARHVPMPEAPKEVPKPGRVPTRVVALREQAANAIDDVVQSVGRFLVTRLEKREERRLAAAKIAAGRLLPPVPEPEREVSRAIEALLEEDASRGQAVKDNRKVIEEHERNRRIKLERIEAFEEAKRFVVEGNRKLREATKLVKEYKTALYDIEHRRLDAEIFDEPDRPGSPPKRLSEAEKRARAARQAFVDELTEKASAKRAELVAANGEVERLQKEVATAKDGVVKAAAGLESAHVDIQEHVHAAEEEARLSKVKLRQKSLKKKLLKAAALGSIMRSATGKIGEEGKELARRKSRVPESLLIALHEGLEKAGPRLADFLGRDGLRRLAPARRRVEIDHRVGHVQPNFKMLYLRRIGVVLADFWTTVPIWLTSPSLDKRPVQTDSDSAMLR